MQGCALPHPHSSCPGRRGVCPWGHAGSDSSHAGDTCMQRHLHVSLPPYHPPPRSIKDGIMVVMKDRTIKSGTVL